jgi:D-lactate dehydrogenase
VGLLFFENLEAAAQAVLKLPRAEISALEIMDYQALKAAQLEKIFNLDLQDFPQHAALLVDLKAQSSQKLASLIKEINAIHPDGLIHRTEITTERTLYHTVWNIRKGIFPSIASLRKPGSALINEDVAVPLPYLPAFCKILSLLFKKHGFDGGCMFGHAKEGNLHFLLEADFVSPAGIKQYELFMQDLVTLVLYYKGALKAEHGTGRNMAHTVAEAFGPEAYQIMQDIKSLFDPLGILNPDVILSANPQLHLQNLKTIPLVDPLIDACIECGFCEKVCPSKTLSLTPRQRIVALRDFGMQWAHTKAFRYRGVDTCAKTGLCEIACPVGLNTGALMGAIMTAKRRPWQRKMAAWISRHLHWISRWFYHPPTAAPAIPQKTQTVLYFPSCGERIFDREATAFQASLRNILKRCGIELLVIGVDSELVWRQNTLLRVPQRSEDLSEQAVCSASKLAHNPHTLCCGLAFKSKGFPEIANQKHTELKNYLDSLSDQGRIPILTETASCIEGLPLRDVLDYLADLLLPTDWLQAVDETIMLHLTCSMKRQHLDSKITALAKRCAKQVIIPPDIDCCGFAGDKGFTLPALNASALKTLRNQIPPECHAGFSGSPSCERGLSKHSGIPYRSLVYLIEQAVFNIKAPK